MDLALPSERWIGCAPQWAHAVPTAETTLALTRVSAPRNGRRCGAQPPDRPAVCRSINYVRRCARISVGVPSSLLRHQRVNADCSEKPTSPATSAIA